MIQIFQSRGSLSQHPLYPLDSSVPALPYGFNPNQMPPLHSSMSNGTETQFPLNNLNSALHRNLSMQLPAIDGFGEDAQQVIKQNLAYYISIHLYVFLGHF